MNNTHQYNYCFSLCLFIKTIHEYDQKYVWHYYKKILIYFLSNLNPKLSKCNFIITNTSKMIKTRTHNYFYLYFMNKQGYILYVYNMNHSLFPKASIQLISFLFTYNWNFIIISSYHAIVSLYHIIMALL